MKKIDCNIQISGNIYTLLKVAVRDKKDNDLMLSLGKKLQSKLPKVLNVVLGNHQYHVRLE